MRSAAQTSRLSLEQQVRAYDLLQMLGEASDRGILPSESISKEFCEVYEESADALDRAYDTCSLLQALLPI